MTNLFPVDSSKSLRNLLEKYVGVNMVLSDVNMSAMGGFSMFEKNLGVERLEKTLISKFIVEISKEMKIMKKTIRIFDSVKKSLFEYKILGTI